MIIVRNRAHPTPGVLRASSGSSAHYCTQEAMRTQALADPSFWPHSLWLYNHGIPKFVVLYGKENDDEEADCSCRDLFIRPGDLPAWNCFEQQRGQKCGHVREANRADLSEALRGVPS